MSDEPVDPGDGDDITGTESRPTDAELDGLRIRRLAALRQSAYRSRSYAVIAATACAVVAVQLLIMTVRYVRSIGWDIRPIAYNVLAIGAAYGAFYFAGRAIESHRETTRSSLSEPSAPPDFTPLSDGSQHAKNLEDVR